MEKRAGYLNNLTAEQEKKLSILRNHYAEHEYRKLLNDWSDDFYKDINTVITANKTNKIKLKKLAGTSILNEKDQNIAKTEEEEEGIEANQEPQQKEEEEQQKEEEEQQQQKDNPKEYSHMSTYEKDIEQYISNRPLFILDDCTLLRFLRARKWKVKAAIEQINKVIAWRKKYHVDHILYDPPQRTCAIYKDAVPSKLYHIDDIDGNPVLLHNTCKIAVNYLIYNVRPEDVSACHAYTQELNMRRCIKNSIKYKKN